MLGRCCGCGEIANAPSEHALWTEFRSSVCLATHLGCDGTCSAGLEGLAYRWVIEWTLVRRCRYFSGLQIEVGLRLLELLVMKTPHEW